MSRCPHCAGLMVLAPSGDVEACVQYREGGPLMFDLDEASVRRVVDSARENLRETPLTFTASPKRFRVWTGTAMVGGEDFDVRLHLGGSVNEIEWVVGGREVHADNTRSEWIALQSTGLHDADGVEVFEGDIIEWRENSEIHACLAPPLAGRGLVQMIDGAWAVSADYDTYARAPWSMPRHTHVLVVGNVFENPDLLPGVTG